MRIRPIFAWYDLWVGAFIDRPKQRLYLFPLPMLGVVIDFGQEEETVTEQDIYQGGIPCLHGDNVPCLPRPRQGQ